MDGSKTWLWKHLLPAVSNVLRFNHPLRNARLDVIALTASRTPQRSAVCASKSDHAERPHRFSDADEARNIGTCDVIPRHAVFISRF